MHMTNATLNNAASDHHILVNHLSAFITADDYSILQSLRLLIHTFQGYFFEELCAAQRDHTVTRQILKYLFLVDVSVDVHAIDS